MISLVLLGPQCSPSVTNSLFAVLVHETKVCKRFESLELSALLLCQDFATDVDKEQKVHLKNKVKNDGPLRFALWPPKSESSLSEQACGSRFSTRCS